MSTGSKKITLKSSDEETFEVDEVVARESQVIKTMFELDPNCMDSVIPLPKITSKILAKVIEYCTKHVEAENNTAAVNEELKAWDASFVMVDQDTLFELIEVANILDIKGLLDVTCQAVADILTGKTRGDMHKTIQIMYGFTPEEQELIRRENAWAFE